MLSLAATLLPMMMAAGAPAAPDAHAAQAPAPAEAQGWRSLFDGKTTEGWRAFKSDTFPLERWKVEDGALKQAGAHGERGTRDIITKEKFADFDFRFEWKVAPGGNSGVKYLVTEERSGPIAHEYQVVDDEKNPDAKIGPHRQTASFYDVLPPAKDVPRKPAGEWNESRILVKGNHVEHWLNGRKVLEYELGSPELQAAIAKSKFKDVAGFDAKLEGHLLLQDHGDEVWYRNLRIQAPPKP
jgi:3-keto-disaccharide hydrolase